MRIIDGKFFLKVDAEAENDKVIKVIVTDGLYLWESTKGKDNSIILDYFMYKVLLDDLMKMKPEGIEDSIQSAAISIALHGDSNNSFDSGNGLKKEDLIVEIIEIGSGGNLNFIWKLKQSYGITIILGMIFLLKQFDQEHQKSTLMHLLSYSTSIYRLETELKMAQELNRKLLEEYEMVVERKLEWEEEMYTKFRILFNNRNKLE